MPNVLQLNKTHMDSTSKVQEVLGNMSLLNVYARLRGRVT